MIGRPVLLVAAALATVAIRAGTSAAQTGWEFNVHGATLLDDLFPESGGSIQAGARLVHTTRWQITVGGNFDWARTREIVLEGTDGVTADLLLASAELGYAAPVSPRAEVMLAGGAGSATVRLGDVPAVAGILESSSGLLVPIGLGVRVRNRPEGATWAFRADVRDQIIFLDVVDPGGGAADPEPRHNLELSAGLSLLFGGPRETPRPVEGRPPARPAVRREPPAAEAPEPPAAERRERPEAEDADRDGVPDRLDRCARTPSELAVGPTGCPIDMDRDGTPDPRQPRVPPAEPAREADVVEEAPPPARGPEPVEIDRDRAPAGADTDRDGVPDPSDRCVNTPPDTTVDERGCPVAPVVRPAPVPEEERAEPEAGPPAPEPVAEPEAPGPPPPAAGACLDARPWNRPGVTIAFDGRLWEQLGPPEPITADNLERVGDFDGVPIYVAAVARPPFQDIWVPRCTPTGVYQLYVEEGTE